MSWHTLHDVNLWLSIAVVLAIIYVPVGVLMAVTGKVTKRR